MKSKIFPIIWFVIFITVFFIFYKGLQNSNIYVPENNIEKKIPIFEVKKFASDNLINSNQIFLSNKFYLLNIWSSWCVPCREEHIFLMRLKELDNLVIVGLNYKDKIENARSFLNEFKNPYDLIILDNNGTISIEWGAYGVPESFLIYDKKIIKKIIGPINEKFFFEIKDLIK